MKKFQTSWTSSRFLMSQLWHTTDSRPKMVFSKTGCGHNLPKLLLPQCQKKKEKTKLLKTNNFFTRNQLSTLNQQPTPSAAPLNPSLQTSPSLKISCQARFQSPTLCTTNKSSHTPLACGWRTLAPPSLPQTHARASRPAHSLCLMGALHFGSIAKAASEFMCLRRIMLMRHHRLLFSYR